jgi:hypothetical protein
MNSLQVVSLVATDITDAGLQSFWGMTYLKILRVNGPGVSIDAIKKLERALPETEIYN